MCQKRKENKKNKTKKLKNYGDNKENIYKNCYPVAGREITSGSDVLYTVYVRVRSKTEFCRILLCRITECGERKIMTSRMVQIGQ